MYYSIMYGGKYRSFLPAPPHGVPGVTIDTVFVDTCLKISETLPRRPDELSAVPESYNVK